MDVTKLEKLYGGSALETVEGNILGMEFDLDFSLLRLSLRLAEFPSTPPDEWLAHQYTDFRIEIEILHVELFEMVGWDWQLAISMSMVDAGNGVRITSNAETQIEVVGRTVSVTDMVPYHTW